MVTLKMSVTVLSVTEPTRPSTGRAWEAWSKNRLETSHSQSICRVQSQPRTHLDTILMCSVQLFLSYQENAALRGRPFAQEMSAT